MSQGIFRRRLITRSLVAFMDNDLTAASAAVSYFTMLAFFPTLLLLLTLGNYIIGEAAVEKHVMRQVLEFFPGAKEFVRKNIESIANISTGVIVSCVIAMLWAASWVFTVIEKALNRVWGTEPRSFLHGRVMNFAVMSLIWVLLGASALLTTGLSAARALAERFPLRVGAQLAAMGDYLWQSVFILASFAVTVALFTMLYKLLPNTHVSFVEALVGAVLAGALWEGAKFGFAYLLPYFHYDLLYGSIGAGVAILSWVYLSSVIMLFGAQFTALLHRDHLFEALEKKLGYKPADLPAAVNE